MFRIKGSDLPHWNKTEQQLFTIPDSANFNLSMGKVDESSHKMIDKFFSNHHSSFRLIIGELC